LRLTAAAKIGAIDGNADVLFSTVFEDKHLTEEANAAAKKAFGHGVDDSGSIADKKSGDVKEISV